MKLLFLILTLCAVDSWALTSRHVILTAASPMPTTYSASNTKSLIMSEMGSIKYINFVNYTNFSVQCLFTRDAVNNPTTPSDNNVQQFQTVSLSASEKLKLDLSYPTKQLFCRGETGSPVGDFYVNAW